MNNLAPTLRLEAALARMRTGSRLVHTNSRKGLTWYVVPGGAVSDGVAISIRQHPAVVGAEDGLFPGLDQTWRMSNFVS